jgi:hypothetical protein
MITFEEALASDDTASFVYDDDVVAHFIEVTTGIAFDVVAQFVASMDRYHLGMGIIQSSGDAEDAEMFGTTVAALRREHPRLFPQDRDRGLLTVQPHLQRAFIVLDANLEAETVARLQRAHDQYMRKIGLTFEVVVDE